MSDEGEGGGGEPEGGNGEWRSGRSNSSGWKPAVYTGTVGGVVMVTVLSQKVHNNLELWPSVLWLLLITVQKDSGSYSYNYTRL